MSESSSGVTTLRASFPISSSSGSSDLGVALTPPGVDPRPDSGLGSTPGSAGTDAECGGGARFDTSAAGQLPSGRFRFASWRHLERCDVTGDQLRCPRVREGPSEDQPLGGDEGGACLVRRRRKDEGQSWEDRLQENWENCLELNLSYQDLGDPFQRDNFLRILRRLIRVEKLQLVSDRLTDLSSVRLPRCRMLNLQQNHLLGLRQLPKLPLVEHLCLSQNAIGSLGGLGALGEGPLRSLSLSRNPVSFTPNYRARVFACLPKLEVLDGIPKLPEDSLPSRLRFPESTRMCSIL